MEALANRCSLHSIREWCIIASLVYRPQCTYNYCVLITDWRNSQRFTCALNKFFPFPEAFQNTLFKNLKFAVIIKAPADCHQQAADKLNYLYPFKFLPVTSKHGEIRAPVISWRPTLSDPKKSYNYSSELRLKILENIRHISRLPNRSYSY